MGVPLFDDTGAYLGPLPKLTGIRSVRDGATPGPFKTIGAEQWPLKMCQWVATLLLDACTATAATSSGGQERDKIMDGEVDKGYPICEPEGYRVHEGEGPPRYCEMLSGYKDFHDGGGLCSPGRWRRDARKLADGAGW